jgi:hypothetical protein
MPRDWTTTIQDAAALRDAFAGAPAAKYRPVPMWWWSGDPLDEERLLWQVDRIADLGCGAVLVTGLALHGTSTGSAPDDPLGYTDEWLALYRSVCKRLSERGLSMMAWSFLQAGLPVDTHRLLEEHPGHRGEQVVPGPDGPRIETFGFDYGSAEAVDALVAPGTMTRRYLDAMDDMADDVVVALFEDEFAAFPRWAPGFADEYREITGDEPVWQALASDVGPETPALRCRMFDVAARRVEGAYTRVVKDWVDQHDILAGYDQMHRRGTPLISTSFYLDPFRTMAWANAHGTDHMGDARFAASVVDLTGGSRVMLEGFHSHGWGMTLEHQHRLLHVWAREGATLFIPHGCYYANRGMWWEWASPEMCFKQPFARHYPAFAEAIGRLMSVASAGHHVPDVAVLYPLSTAWAGTEGPLTWDDDATRADKAYCALFGVHDTPSGWEPERAARPSLLAVAGYDRVAVDEVRVDHFGPIPIVLPSVRCLPTATLRALVEGAEAGRCVVVVEPVPEWSAEVGRDDPEFAALAERLRAAATVVADPADVVAALPPPRAEGNETQWRRVGDLDVVLAGGGREVRFRGMADRAAELWDLRTGSRGTLPATVDGADLLVDVPFPAAVIALPLATEAAPPLPPAPGGPDVELPTTWRCDYLPWGENRWGDYRLPATEGTPPVERRTFAHREGDDPSWRLAPVVPEDVQHPIRDVGFEQRMGGDTGRPAPADRALPDGWHEVVSTYGPKAVVTDPHGSRALVEWSERLGIEDRATITNFGMRGFVEPIMVNVGSEGAGDVSSWGHVADACDTHLVVEATGIVTVRLDGRHLVGPVEAGVLSVPVHLDAGWHHVEIGLASRLLARPLFSGYRPMPSTRVAWAFTEPYRRPATGGWSGQMWHPDYKGSPGPRRFRRAVHLPEAAAVRVIAHGTGGIESHIPESLPAGEHSLEITCVGGPGASALSASIEITMSSATVWIVTDEFWESTGDGETWIGIFEPAHSEMASGVPPTEPTIERGSRRHPLLDVGWLEGAEATRGHVTTAWADTPDDPPPAWFCFLAPPGAQRMSLPIVGAIEAWIDGERVEPVDGWLPLVEHARVALRVTPPAGWRGAACFTEHPVLELGPGTIDVGTSWHRLGLDCFSGVILHTAEIDVAAELAGPAVLDLGEVIGSVAVRVNGEAAGTVLWAPWMVDVDLQPGPNLIELEVANTLGPMAGRGIPTPYGPEDQRRSGIIGRPRLTTRRSND